MLHSSLTLQQVVGGGGLVVSPTIQLLTSPQGFKVINQPNGLTTIELSPQINGQAPASIQRPTHQITTTQNAQPANLQKLLLNGNGATATAAGNINTISIPSLTHQTNGNHRLTPGGAELNLLPSNSTTSNGAIYRNQGKLIVKESNNSSSRLHVVQSAPALVVSQPQNSAMTHIITSSSPSQLAGKMLHQSTAPQYVQKPMIVVNNGNGSPTNELGKI